MRIRLLAYDFVQNIHINKIEPCYIIVTQQLKCYCYNQKSPMSFSCFLYKMTQGFFLSDRFYYIKHNLCACFESIAEFVAVHDVRKLALRCLIFL